MDDDSVGEIISGSSGSPSQLAVPALNFDGAYELRNLRFKYLGNPIQCESETRITARNVQFIDSYAPFILRIGFAERLQCARQRLLRRDVGPVRVDLPRSDIHNPQVRRFFRVISP